MKANKLILIKVIKNLDKSDKKALAFAGIYSLVMLGLLTSNIFLAKKDGTNLLNLGSASSTIGLGAGIGFITGFLNSKIASYKEKQK